MTAFDDAMTRAGSGLDWSYPCLIWVADYLRDYDGQGLCGRLARHRVR
jgi:hypothetical protein